MNAFIENIISVISTPLTKIGNTDITLTAIIVSLLILAISYIIALFIGNMVRWRLLAPHEVDKSTSLVITKAITWFIVLLGAIIALKTVGIELTSLVVALGVGGVALGFGLQKIISNVVSGFIVLSRRDIKIGDRIQVSDVWGDVVDIGIMNTTVLTTDNIEIMIPNENLITEKLINYTKTNRNIRIRIPIGVSYDSDIEKVEEILTEIAKESDEVLKRPEPECVLIGYGDSSINFELRCYIGDAKYRPTVVGWINKQIWAKFRENDIVIPYPQRTIHVEKMVGGIR